MGRVALGEQSPGAARPIRSAKMWMFATASCRFDGKLTQTIVEFSIGHRLMHLRWSRGFRMNFKESAVSRREQILERISVDPNVCFGKPVVRGTRIWVSLILDFLAEGDSIETIPARIPAARPRRYSSLSGLWGRGGQRALHPRPVGYRSMEF